MTVLVYVRRARSGEACIAADRTSRFWPDASYPGHEVTVSPTSPPTAAPTAIVDLP